MTDRSGIRGGDVPTLTAAKALHADHKPFTVATVTDEILRTLIRKGECHPDDLAHLEIPASDLSVIGSSFARLVNRGAIEPFERRRCTHPAANGRKANVYRLAEKGRRIVGDRAEGRGQGMSATALSITRPANATPSSVSGDQPTSPRSLSSQRGEAELEPTTDPRERARREDALVASCQRFVDETPGVEWVTRHAQDSLDLAA